MEDQVLQAKCLRNVVVEERGADGAVLARTELSPQLALKKEMGNARLVSDDAMLWVAHGALETQREADGATQRVTLTSGKRSFSFFLACDAPADAFLHELRAQVAGESGPEHARKRRKIRRQLADSQRAGFVPVVHSLAGPAASAAAAKPPTQALKSPSPSTPGRRRLSDVSNSPRRLAPPLPFTVANASASTVSEARGVFPSPSKSPFRSPFRKPGAASPSSSSSSTPAPRRASPIVSLSSLPPKSPAVHATPPSGTSSAASSASPRPPREWLSPARVSSGSGAAPGRVRVQLTPPSIRRDPSLTPASSSASEKENTPVRAASGGIVNKRVRSLQRMLDDVPREEPEHTAGARPPPVRSPYFLSPTNAREMSPVRRPSPAKKLRNSPSRVLGELHQNTTPPLRPLSASRAPGSNPQSGATSLLAGESGLRKVTHGLLNLGNFCYMNAIVQSLAALPGFADRLQKADWIVSIIKKLLTAKGTERSAQEIAELLAKWKQADAGDRLAVQDKLALLLQQVIDGSDSSINPEPLKAVMGRRNPRFASHFQQDAHEFLLQLVTEYEKELVQAVDGVLKSAAADVSNEPASTQEPEPSAELPPTEQPPAPKKTSLLNFFRLGKKADDADANPSAAPSFETATAAVAAPSSALDSKEQELLVTELFPAECFRTELYRTLTCCSCKYSRRQVEKFYDFSLDLPFVPLPKSPAFEPQPEPCKPDSASKQCHCGVDAALIESAGERFYTCAKSACSLRDKVEESAEPAEPDPSPIKATTEPTALAASEHAVSERPSFNAIQLSDLLKDQFKSEVLELTCEKCKDGREATARYEVKSLPRVLVLHLKRFEVNPQTGTLYKRCDLVEAPRELFPVQDIHGCDAHAPELGDLADKRYTIKSVVHHLGKTVDEGHYVADVCGPRGVWRRRNDTHETFISEDFALRASRSQESCYMMFYVLATPADELEKDKENLTATTPTAPKPTRSPVVSSATTPDSPASLVGRRREMTPPRRDASKVSKSLHDLL